MTEPARDALLIALAEAVLLLLAKAGAVGDEFGRLADAIADVRD